MCGNESEQSVENEVDTILKFRNPDKNSWNELAPRRGVPHNVGYQVEFEIDFLRKS